MSKPSEIDHISTFLGKVLNDSDKTKFLFNSKVSSSVTVFPATDGRRYSAKWEEKFPWLKYSVQNDAAFFAYCIAFGQPTSGDVFAEKGFKDWTNATGMKRGMLISHNEPKGHHDACLKTVNYKEIVSNEEKDVCVSISKSYEEKVKRNREILLRIIDTIVVLGQQNIPFLGKNWDMEIKQEYGNFTRFLRWKAEDVSALKDHLDSASYNVKYTSPDIQNELINLAGLHIKESIIQHVKKSKWFSIMADESTYVATKEQMTLYVRHVDDKATVFEDFIGFVEMEKVDAEAISTAIVTAIRDVGLSMDNLRGQGYDGASVMSGEVSSIKTRIQQIQPRAFYHHCRAHVLNLVVASTCKSLPEIRNLFDSVSQLTWFLGGSAKRNAIVFRYLPQDDTSKLVVSDDSDNELMISETLIDKASRKHLVPKLCETRWTARVDTLSALTAEYKCITQSLGDIQTESTVSDARLKAESYLGMLQSSPFIVALFVAQHILSFTRPLTQALQQNDCDIIKACNDANICKTVIQKERSDAVFENLWGK